MAQNMQKSLKDQGSAQMDGSYIQTNNSICVKTRKAKGPNEMFKVPSLHFIPTTTYGPK